MEFFMAKKLKRKTWVMKKFRSILILLEIEQVENLHPRVCGENNTFEHIDNPHHTTHRSRGEQLGDVVLNTLKLTPNLEGVERFCCETYTDENCSCDFSQIAVIY